MKRNDIISNERIVLDNQKSIEKRARTVWELKGTILNLNQKPKCLRSCILSFLAR